MLLFRANGSKPAVEANPPPYLLYFNVLLLMIPISTGVYVVIILLIFFFNEMKVLIKYLVHTCCLGLTGARVSLIKMIDSDGPAGNKWLGI